MHLILLPGLDGTGELFAPLVRVLGDSVTTSVVRYGSELTFDEYVESAARALPDDAVVVAESFSGPVGIALAARHPGKIRCLVLCATFARSPFRTLLRFGKFIPARAFAANALTPAMLRHFCLNGNDAPPPIGRISSEHGAAGHHAGKASVSGGRRCESAIGPDRYSCALSARDARSYSRCA